MSEETISELYCFTESCLVEYCFAESYFEKFGLAKSGFAGQCLGANTFQVIYVYSHICLLSQSDDRQSNDQQSDDWQSEIIGEAR